VTKIRGPQKAENSCYVSLSDPNIFLSILFSNTLNCVLLHLGWETKSQPT